MPKCSTARLANTRTTGRLTECPARQRRFFAFAAYELTFTDVPPKAAVNEAIEIAKEYAGEEEASFINGILNTFAKAKGFIEVNTDGAQPKDSCKTNE